jgi:hypothetical protein
MISDVAILVICSVVFIVGVSAGLYYYFVCLMPRQMNKHLLDPRLEDIYINAV